MTIWREDVLGAPWQQRDLPLPGGAMATLVRRVEPGFLTPDAASPLGQAPGSETLQTSFSGANAAAGAAAGRTKPAVLYLHGFVDYFFHFHVANAFEARGYRFYAIDLRGYGRSIGQGAEESIPNFVTDLSVYAEDLDAAVAAIRAEGHDQIAFVGHSTGGLIGPLWANSRPGLLKAMALNSPWLELNGNWFMRGPLTWAIEALGGVLPRAALKGLWPYYGRALHRDTGGEWDYNLAWKPHLGFPTCLGWLREIRRAHRRIARGLNVDCPILVATSDRRGPNTKAHAEVITTDSVLDPQHMWDRAPRLGSRVEVRIIPGGAHDLALSPAPARDLYLETVLDWFDSV